MPTEPIKNGDHVEVIAGPIKYHATVLSSSDALCLVVRPDHGKYENCVITRNQINRRLL